ncbi:MAG: hypothetical protein ABIP44_12410 [Pseudoxanthomonas sp.]
MKSRTPDIVRRGLLTALIVAVAVPAIPQEAGTMVRVTFDGDHGSRTFENAIDGFNDVSYVVAMRAGQSLQVSLGSNNISNCFDLYAPGATKPSYIGGDSGSTHRMLAKTAGDYVVKVFLLRLAARDNQSAQYSLELTLTN